MLPNQSEVLTPQELRLKTFLKALFFLLYVGALFLYLLPAITFIPDFLKPYGFLNDAEAYANNSSIKMGIFAALVFFCRGRHPGKTY